MQRKCILVWIFLMLTDMISYAQESDPFAPWLTGQPPAVAEDLGTEAMADGIRVQKLVFRSRTGSFVYAAIAFPAGKGPFPGLLRLHGGGGAADIPAAISSAKAGYASIVIDIPGIAGVKARSSKTTGPWNGRAMITAKPDVTYSALFDAVLSSVQAFYLLRAQPGVDKNRMCIAGASWGGYTATMVAALLDKDNTATWSVFGSGNFELGAYEKDHINKLPADERSRWQRWLDPGRRAQNISKPYFISTASNDRHWSWMAVQATNARMKGLVNQFYSPNDNHAINYRGARNMLRFFDHYVKQTAPPLPVVTAEKTARLKDGRLQVSFTAKHVEHVAKAEVYYTGKDSIWTTKKWISAAAVKNGNGFTAYLPSSETCYWYAIVSAKNGNDTIACSSLVQEVNPAAGLPLIFHSGETAGAGDVFGLQGTYFGQWPEVWYAPIEGDEKTLKPAGKLSVLSASDRNITAQLPDTGIKKGQLLAVWVKNSYGFSKPVLLNKARAVSVEHDEIMPEQSFRIFGRNLVAEGYQPVVQLKAGKSILVARTDHADAYTITVTAPAGVKKGVRYSIMISNGAGNAWGTSLAEEHITGRAPGADPFHLKVPWGADFSFSKEIYNVKTDPRLTVKAKGDGLTDDRKAIQQAIDLVHKKGGGVVYLPAGKYKLEIPSGSGLVMQSKVVLQGEGPEQTIIQYGYDTPPPYPNPIGKGGWPDSTTDGVAILWPLKTTLSGLYNLQVQNVNTSGRWRHSLKNMQPALLQPGAAGSKFFVSRCRFDLAVAWGLSWGYVDRMVITDCSFESKAQVTWPWMWHCNGSTNFVVRNNIFRYSAGRFGFNEAYNGIIENNHITRLGDLQTARGETGGFNIDYSSDIMVLNNRMDVEGREIEYHNQGETILSQGGDPKQMDAGIATGATSNTLTDTRKKWGLIRTPRLNSCDVIAIVDGKGAGQWRRILKNNAGTITIERTWEVIPDQSSHYILTRWSAEDWLVKGNILEGNNRGIWFYCGNTDVAIVNNQLTNSEGIYLRADQRLAIGRYNLTWNTLVADNSVINTNGLRPAFVCNTLALVSPDSLFGLGSVGVEIRRNYVQAHQPNSASFVNGEGYWNEVHSKLPVKPGVTGVIGTIFDQNKVAYADTGYRLHHNIDQTIVKDPVYRQVKAKYTVPGNTVFMDEHRPDNDPFTPFLTDEAPVVIKELGDSAAEGVTIRKLLFHSRDVQTAEGVVPTKIFAAVIRPAAPGKYPGLLVLHGGGGTAEIERGIRWARQGYIVVTPDLPGITEPKKALQSSGYWKTFTYGTQRFTAKPDVTHSTIFDAVLAALQGLYLLHDQADVLKGRIGVTGISWGGYMTTMLSGLAAPYVNASFSTYGAGFYDTNSVFLKDLDKMPAAERATWLKYLDAGRRAGNINAPFFIAAASNDNWFYPPAVMATLQAVQAPTNHFFAPNANHTAPVPGGSGRKEKVGTMDMELTYFNYYLKGDGMPLPVIAEETSAVQFFVESKTTITDVSVYYSTDTLWTKRKWIACKAIPVEGKTGWYYAILPDNIRQPGTWWYASVSDDRPVTVSGRMMEFK